MSIGRRTRERADVPKSGGGGLWRLCETESRQGDEQTLPNTQFLELLEAVVLLTVWTIRSVGMRWISCACESGSTQPTSFIEPPVVEAPIVQRSPEPLPPQCVGVPRVTASRRVKEVRQRNGDHVDS
jgi:hypothetical protein